MGSIALPSPGDHRPNVWPAGLLLTVAVTLGHGAKAAEVDLTRYLWRASDGTVSGVWDETFSAVPGEARLIVSNSLPGTVLRLNGDTFAFPDAVREPGRETATAETPVNVVSKNTITIDGTGTGTSVRVKQVADVELNVQARVHFNTNVSDFEAARAFYGKLGFETVTGFPDTNTLEMARSIGITTPTSYDGSQGDAAGGYLLHGELIAAGGFGSGLIDLIEFTIPRNDAPPYAALNHLGMARAAMLTTDIDADYAYMKKLGVRFVSAPVARSDGSRFAMFRDLDGTFYELLEIDGDRDDTDTTHIAGLGHVSINVSDFERSLAWYRMLGFELTERLARTESVDVARAMGIDAPFEVDGALVTHVADESTLQLVQWLAPYDADPPYDIPINHLGIHRIAFSTSDIEADVAALTAQGVRFISPITPCCSGPDSWGSIVAFYDPDGTIVELVEQPGMTEILAVIRWFREIF